MVYSAKELFFTLQGEGRQAGRPAVFLRFAGCNLWSGREADRQTAICRFCDTDFVGTDGPGGGRFDTPQALAQAARRLWPDNQDHAYIVCTGGEPLLQLDPPLIGALKAEGFEVALETNGTLPVPDGVDWICVSPKQGADLVQLSGAELKLVYPQEGCDPGRFEALDFRHFLLQPMDGPDLARNTAEAIHYCKSHPRWSLSVQTHKVLGLP